MLPYAFRAALILLSVLSAVHALLYKRDSRASLGWIVLCLAVPGFGPFFYWTLGVNYIRTRGRRIQRQWSTQPVPGLEDPATPSNNSPVVAPETLAADWRTLAVISANVTRRPLLSGNRIEPLFNGEEAYPRMLAAIDSARNSLQLATYIFDTSPTGREFVDALARAAQRGVEVRVLLDGIGEKYSWPWASHLLRQNGVTTAKFLSPSLRHPGLHMNLRNHRKFLLVDSRVGFTGGMNIGRRHLVQDPGNRQPTADLHFRVEGPVVAQMLHAFLEDWRFASDQPILAAELPPLPSPCGPALCRGITDGPNEDFDKLRWLIVSGIASAQRKVRIMTPYFIPDREMIFALNAAALRGATVDLVLPRRSNLVFVDWATRAMLWEILAQGVRVHLQPDPFAHSKLLLIDDGWSLIGSANLDPRSLRLNFEFNLEIYDHEFHRRLENHVLEVIARSQTLTLADVDGRPLWRKIRDATARLLSPYL